MTEVKRGPCGPFFWRTKRRMCVSHQQPSGIVVASTNGMMVFPRNSISGHVMMKNDPLVSIVVPVFNGAPFLARAVDSVLAQTWQDFEIVIVDDGSTDDTKSLLDQLGTQSKIRCLFQDHTGPAQARNAGIQSAFGAFIAFLDCDDVWLPEKLERQMMVFGRTNPPGLVHSDYIVLAPDGRVIQHAKAGQSQDVFHQVFTGGHAPLLSTTIVSRALVDQIGGFDPRLWVSEDSDLILRLYAVTSFECIDCVLVHKFQQPPIEEDFPIGCDVYQEKVLQSRERFLTHVQNRSTLYQEQQHALDREWSSFYLMKGAYEERQGRWSEARKQYRAAIHKDPCRWRGYSRFLRVVRW